MTEMAIFKVEDIEYQIIRNPKTQGPMIARVDGWPIENRKEICRKFLRAHGWTDDMMPNEVITNTLERRVNDIVNGGIISEPIRVHKTANHKHDIRENKPIELSIESNEDPYVLDYAIGCGLKIPALSRKNASFIEAVVGLDSNYNRDADIDAKPDDGFDPFKNVSSSNGKYCGSSAYWFHKMENGGDFEECLLGAIISIDRTNSTHLESAVNGRTAIKDIIMSVCKNVSDLKAELNKDFNNNPKQHLIGLMSDEMAAKKSGTKRSNLSFASKFCSYASIYLKTELEYSKYDNVVASHLGDYIKLYMKDTSTKLNEYKYDSIRKNNSKDGLQYTVNIYVRYFQLIGNIIDVLKEKGIKIDRNEFDHIVWYGFKGK